jgi:hypothetical protein
MKGCGNVVNVPLKRGDGSKHVRAAFVDTILPALRKFEPELVTPGVRVTSVLRTWAAGYVSPFDVVVRF